MSRLSLIVFDLDGTLVDSRKDIADAANTLLVACGANPLPEATIGRLVGDGAATLIARAFEAAGGPAPPDALGARTALAVLTNKPRPATMRILAGLDLARYFSEDAIVGGDGPFPRKPDPAGLRHLAARAGVSLADTVLVGDSVIDWRTARNGKAHVCLARYGFGFEGFPLDQIGPEDCVVDAAADLLEVL